MKNIFCILFLFLFLGFCWADESVEDSTAEIMETEEEAQDFSLNNTFSSDAFLSEDLSEFFSGDSEDFSEAEEPEENIADSLGRARVTMFASYNFLGGFSPGWSELPWLNENDLPQKNDLSYLLAAKMEALLSLDFQLAENLRVWNSFYFSVPPDSSSFFTLKEFYFDFDFYKKVFLRAGQYEIAWGISPNFPYTNLPSRVPAGSYGGDAYIVRLDIPIGLGGLQMLAMTRHGFMEDPESPRFGEIAFGGKYNLALPAADINAGIYYHKEMNLRFFTSVKSTIEKTELYAEGMAAFDLRTWEEYWFSYNAGLVRDFFNKKLTAGGELFYNGELGAYWFRAKDDFREAETSPFFDGWNSALNLIFRPGVLGMRLFCQFLYAWELNSAQLVPGISIQPLKQFTATLTVPMALGTRDEHSYYRNNVDTNDRPFSIILGININGSFRYRIYMDRSAE